MSERHGPHKGRDLDGRYRVRQEDVDEILENPDGVDILRDDVRLGGAVADTGAHAGESGERVSRIIEENREDVSRLVHPDSGGRGKGKGKGKRKK